MFAAMLAGYLIATVAFYSYIVATAQEEPKEEAAPVRTLSDWQRQASEDVRRAA